MRLEALTDTQFMDEEFWWLTRLGLPISGQVGAALNRWTPPQCDSWFSKCSDLVGIDSLASWAAQREWENVHRTLEVSNILDTHSFAAGPLVVDIDTDENCFDDRAKPSDSQMEDGRRLTLAAVEYYTRKGVPLTDMRISFSGHKGFHVELVFPTMTDLHYSSNWKRLWNREIRELRGTIRSSKINTTIDPVHDHVRLNTSINRWGPLEFESRQRATRVTREELLTISMAQLWERSNTC